LLEYEAMKGKFEETLAKLNQTEEEKQGKIQELAQKELVRMRFEMQTEDLSSFIGITLKESLQVKQDELNQLVLKNSELSDLVEEGKKAAEERDKFKNDVDRVKEELNVTRGEYLTIKKEKDKM